MANSEIYVYGGGLVDPNNLGPQDVDIDVIAHALSNLCRFGGHTSEFYSVAEHSVRVAGLCPPEHALAGLLHDAAEAYIGDVVRPLKRRICVDRDNTLRHSFEDYEQCILNVIFQRFGLPTGPLPQSVLDADAQMLQVETAWLIHETDGEDAEEPLSPCHAKQRFLETFEELVLGVGV